MSSGPEVTMTTDTAAPMFFSVDHVESDVGLGSIMDVGNGFDDHDDGDVDTDLLLEDADLLEEDDEGALTVQLPEDLEDDDDFEVGVGSPDAAATGAGGGVKKMGAPKFQMRIQPANKIGKRRRGRPTKEEVAARILANGGVPPAPNPSGTTNKRRRTVTKRQQLLSAKTKSLRRKISSSAWGKVHRERRNGSIDIMKKVIPGVGHKLDTAGVLEMSISYILFLKKKVDSSVDAEFLCKKDSLIVEAK